MINELDGFKEKTDYLKTRPHTKSAAAYIRLMMNILISDFYYASCEEAEASPDAKRYARIMKEHIEAFGDTPALTEEPETDVFLNHAFAIPTIRKRSSRFFHERLQRWSIFMAMYPDLIESKHYKGFAGAMFWLAASAIKSPVRKDKKKELSFCAEQFKRLHKKQKILLVPALFKYYFF